MASLRTSGLRCEDSCKPLAAFYALRDVQHRIDVDFLCGIIPTYPSSELQNHAPGDRSCEQLLKEPPITLSNLNTRIRSLPFSK